MRIRVTVQEYSTENFTVSSSGTRIPSSAQARSGNPGPCFDRDSGIWSTDLSSGRHFILFWFPTLPAARLPAPLAIGFPNGRESGRRLSAAANFLTPLFAVLRAAPLTT